MVTRGPPEFAVSGLTAKGVMLLGPVGGYPDPESVARTLAPDGPHLVVTRGSPEFAVSGLAAKGVIAS